MNAEQIRAISTRANPNDYQEKTAIFLQEIAAQLAEHNELQKKLIDLKVNGFHASEEAKESEHARKVGENTASKFLERSLEIDSESSDGF